MSIIYKYYHKNRYKTNDVIRLFKHLMVNCNYDPKACGKIMFGTRIIGTDPDILTSVGHVLTSNAVLNS